MSGGYIAFRAQREAQSRIPAPTLASPHEGFVVGVDLGKHVDFTAISILERTTVDSSEIKQRGFEPPTVINTTKKIYHLRHLQRLRLGTPYHEVNDIIATILKALPPARMAPALVVDATGSGDPPVEGMQKAGLRPIAIKIHSGHTENRVSSTQWNVPKRNLVSRLAVVMESGRLKVAPDLVFAETFVNELSNFKVKISVSGHDSYDAWRESIHDDLVLSVALAVWFAERPVMPTSINFSMER
jgi:hypothetical protein